MIYTLQQPQWRLPVGIAARPQAVQHDNCVFAWILIALVNLCLSVRPLELSSLHRPPANISGKLPECFCACQALGASVHPAILPLTLAPLMISPVRGSTSSNSMLAWALQHCLCSRCFLAVCLKCVKAPQEWLRGSCSPCACLAPLCTLASLSTAGFTAAWQCV